MPKTRWYTGSVSCQLCGYEWVGVWPAAAQTKALECPACHHCAGMPAPLKETTNA